LKRAAAEARAFSDTAFIASSNSTKWLKSVADGMEAASERTNDADAAAAIRSIAFSIADGGPLTSSFAPSFQTALGMVQAQDKNNAKR
jgi:hypothetical protein